MITKIRNRFQFHLEQLLLRGAQYRFLVIAAVIGLVSILGGATARWLTSEFSSSPEAFWWAFLRLTDPGYLGDDQGTILRILSTVITILGYVLFMGSLIAIMTQWLNHTIERLEEGRTPVSLKNHIVILGWTNRTPAIVRELIHSESGVKRFLQRKGARKLRIAILAGKINPENYHNLVSFVGRQWEDGQVILRSGDALNNNHLMRVDFLRAAAIILPGADFAFGGSNKVDMRTIKTLLSITSHARQSGTSPPFLATELADSRKTEIAGTAYGGSVEVIASDAMISLLIAQNIRHRHLSHVFRELLSYGEGNEIRIRALPGLSGHNFHDLGPCFPGAILLGIIRQDGKRSVPILNPGPDLVIDENDKFIIMARSYDETNPDTNITPSALPREAYRPEEPTAIARRLLLLGWNDMIPSLIRELDKYEHETFAVDIFSALPVRDREDRMKESALQPERVSVRQLDGDYTLPTNLEYVEPAGYDNIIILGCDWLDSAEEADARTLVGFMLLRKLMEKRQKRPHILLELLDPSNDNLFEAMEEDVIVSPIILSHILSHVTLKPELHIVLQELFGSKGAEIYFKDCRHYGLDQREATFTTIQEEVAKRGEIAMGIRIKGSAAGAGLRLNPDRERAWRLEEDDEIVVLTNTGAL